MKIYLASADLGEIRWAAQSGLADGVLTTPALLGTVAPEDDGRDVLVEICRAVTLPVFVSAAAVNEADIFRDGKDLARISDQVIVQVPFVEDAIGAMRRLQADGVRIAATLVFNAAQALLASKVGAVAVVTNLAQLDAQGQDGPEIVGEMRAVFDAHETECDVIAAFASSASQLVACALAGADAIAVETAAMHALLVHPLTDRGLDQFLTDLSRRPKPRSLS